MKTLTWIGAYIIVLMLAKILTSILGDWDNHILLGAIFHLYWLKKDKTP